MLQSPLLRETVQFTANDHVLVLNSAADAFVPFAVQRLQAGTLTLAEDNITMLSEPALRAKPVTQVPFHDYILHDSTQSADVAVLNILYQPGNSWILYALHVAARQLKSDGALYVTGAKDRGIVTVAKRMQELFGNVETLVISKGQRVVRSIKRPNLHLDPTTIAPLRVFADSKLDEGTRHLLAVLQIQATDHALDIGCGAGFVGLHIARQATQGHVTMVDASLAAVAASQQAAQEANLTNVQVIPSDGAQAVLTQKFDLIATNPPFHQGGIQTLEIAERFIRQASRVLRPKGRFYIVANRFLKYEPTLQACFGKITEVGGDTRYKVLLATLPQAH